MTTVLPKIVGLTGGIGSGKSQVRQMLQELGVPCIDADIVAREIHQDPLHPAVAEIARAFPSAITPEGRVSRGSLRTLFAVDPGASARLSAILKPHVMENLSRWTAVRQAPYVVWESALIIEAGIDVDRIATVDASRTLQVARVQTRNPEWTRTQIEALIALQLSRTERACRAHDIISNDGSLEDLARQVTALHHAYLKRWSTV